MSPNTGGTANEVAVVATRRVDHDRVADYQLWSEKVQARLARTPGFISAEQLPAARLPVWKTVGGAVLLLAVIGACLAMFLVLLPDNSGSTAQPGSRELSLLRETPVPAPLPAAPSYRASSR
ncbi:MAG: hypothetical protein WD228_11720 [Mycobacterium sp.]